MLKCQQSFVILTFISMIKYNICEFESNKSSFLSILVLMSSWNFMLSSDEQEQIV